VVDVLGCYLTPLAEGLVHIFSVYFSGTRSDLNALRLIAWAMPTITERCIIVPLATDNIMPGILISDYQNQRYI
jgi:hypothetical protein